jgi:hypothetical protein
MLPSTTTLESLRSGDDDALQALQKALTDGADENVTMIWSPIWGRPAWPPPFLICKDEAIGVTGTEGFEGELVPTEFVAVTVNVYVVPLLSPPTTWDVAAEVNTYGV